MLFVDGWFSVNVDSLIRSVKMLGRAGRGRSIAVAAVHGGVDGALAGGPVDHPVPRVLVPFCRGGRRQSPRRLPQALSLLLVIIARRVERLVGDKIWTFNIINCLDLGNGG